MQEKDQKEGLFWCKLLYPVLFDELENERVSQYLQRLSQQEVTFPNGQVKKPSISTLWNKLRIYRNEGFDAFARKVRKDQGKVRKVPQEVIDKAIELKKDQPKRSHTIINIFLQEHYGQQIPKSTLYRHLRKAGATRAKLGLRKEKVRCRWTRDNVHSLWIGDFEHGPMVLIEGVSYKTYLSAFIDCRSRYIVQARYYLRENQATLEDTLLRAWNIHGSSLALYVDNAKVYNCKALQSACLALKINLLHRRPRDPQGGGLIEKFFQTVQSQFESEIRAKAVLSLDQLNEAFSAWLCVCYHQTVNSDTKETPKDRYQNGLGAIRQVDINSVVKYFYKHEQRTVHRDFADIALYGKFYRVDKKFCSDRLNVYYDPFSKLDTVLLYSLDNQYLGKGKLHRREKKDEPQNSPPQVQPKHDLITLLVNQHKRDLSKQIHGIDYRKAVLDHQWTFISFVQTLAELFGRKGGTSAFSAHEYESLQKIYHQHPNITKNLLTQAFELAENKTIVDVAFQIQILLLPKE